MPLKVIAQITPIEKYRGALYIQEAEQAARELISQ
jgi:hypothetical protein